MLDYRADVKGQTWTCAGARWGRYRDAAAEVVTEADLAANLLRLCNLFHEARVVVG